MSKRHPIKILPPVEYLRECLTYFPKTGALRWKVRPREHFSTTRGWNRTNAQFAGNIAGTIGSRGYWYVEISSACYLVQRVIWKIMTGGEPLQTIDHIDGNRANNAWNNLRSATHMEQSYNRFYKAKHRGVTAAKEKWRSRITVNGFRRDLGRFRTPTEASAAYEKEAKELHGKFYKERP